MTASPLALSGGPLAYRDPGGSGRPVVLLHGLLVDGTFWDPVLARMGGRRHVVPDLPLGSHRLPMHPGADLTPPGLASLVAELLEALDLRDVVLVGSDFGGAVAQLVAADHPGRVGSLVLCPCDLYEHFFPAAFVYLQVLARIPGALWASGQAMRVPGASRLPLSYGLVQKRPVPADTARRWLAPAREDPAVRRDLAKVLRGVDRRHTREVVPRLRAAGVPVHLVWAETQKVFPLSDARRLAADIPGTRLIVVPDSYAHVPLDQPGAVARAVLATGRPE